MSTEEPPIIRDEGAFTGKHVEKPQSEAPTPLSPQEQTPQPEPTPEKKEHAQVTEKEPTLLEEIASWFRGKKP